MLMNKTWPPSYADAAKSPSPFFTSKHDNLFTIQYISNLFIREAMITYYYGSPTFRQKRKKKSERGWWSNEELCLIIVVRQEEGLRDLSSFQKCCKTRFSSTVSKPTTYTQSHVHCNSTGTFEYIPDSAALLSMQGFRNRRGTRGAIDLPKILPDQLTLFQTGEDYAHHITTPLDFQNFLRPWIYGMRVRANNGRS